MNKGIRGARNNETPFAKAILCALAAEFSLLWEDFGRCGGRAIMAEWKRTITIGDSKVTEKDLKANLKVYQERKRPGQDGLKVSIEDCVADALESGNHVVFAQRFLSRYDKGIDKHPEYEKLKRIANAKVDEYIVTRLAGMEKTMPETYEELKANAELRRDLNGLFFVRKEVWGSPKYSIPEELRDYQGGEIPKVKGIYSKSGTKRWKSTTPIPRDVLVMHALLLGLSADETDDLLYESGYPSLYPLEVVDACEIIYLNQFKGDLGRSPYEVLSTVKNAINEILSEIEGKNIVFVKSGKEEGAYIGLLKRGAGRKIDSDLKALKLLFDKMSDDGELDTTFQKSDGLTDFLTNYYVKKIKRVRDTKEYFSEEGMAANDIFTQRYYGFLKKTKDYLYDWERYYKNLVRCTWKLTPAFKSHDFINDPRFQAMAEPVEGSIATTLHNVKNAEKNSDDYYNGCLDLIQLVRTRDTLADSEAFDTLKNKTEDIYTHGKLLIDGELKKKDKPISDTDQKKEKVVGYDYGMRSKKDVVRFALSAGREEDIGEYLMLARYWKKDWYTELISSKNIFGEGGLHPDPVDELLLYALRYRDLLIDAWCKDKGYGESVKIKIRNVFPMRKLFLEISYDISFIYLYCVKRVHTEELRDERRKSVYWEYKHRIRDLMVFPVQWIDYQGDFITYDHSQSTTKNRQTGYVDKGKKANHNDSRTSIRQYANRNHGHKTEGDRAR